MTVSLRSLEKVEAISKCHSRGSGNPGFLDYPVDPPIKSEEDNDKIGIKIPGFTNLRSW